MLVLSRKAGEAVYLDRHIKVTILAVNGDTIRIRFDAPKNVSIRRDNCKNTTRKEKNQAKEGTHE